VLNKLVTRDHSLLLRKFAGYVAMPVGVAVTISSSVSYEKPSSRCFARSCAIFSKLPLRELSGGELAASV